MFLGCVYTGDRGQDMGTYAYGMDEDHFYMCRPGYQWSRRDGTS